METKICSKCGEEKAVAEFYKNLTAHDGLRQPCKQCRAEQNKKYRQENKRRIAEQEKRWRQKNKDRIAERGKKRQQEKKEHIAELKKRWRQKNKEYAAEYTKKWRQENPERTVDHRRKQARFDVSNATDSYIKNLLTQTGGLRRCDISDEFVQFKREQLLILRETKRLNETTNRGTTNE